MRSPTTECERESIKCREERLSQSENNVAIENDFNDDDDDELGSVASIA